MVLNLSIIVYRGDPVDLQTTRHTALFVCEVGQEEGIVLHVAGASSFFEFEQRPEVNPRLSRTFIKQIFIIPIQVPTKEQLISAIASTAVDNNTRSWNCQHWVESALGKLASMGWIDGATKSKAVNEMVDVTMEAKDEIE